MLHGEREAGANRDALTVDAQAFVVAAFQPGEPLAVELRVLGAHADQVVDDRATADLRETLLHRQVNILVTGEAVVDLDEAFAALAQHFTQRVDVFLRHGVGHHRRAVVVGLRGVGTEALQREPAGARLHRLVEQPLHLRTL